MAKDRDDNVGFGNLVCEDGTSVSRRLFYDDTIFEVEKTKVFGRSWLFLGHESQIENEGDYFLSRMGDESVIIARDKKGNINAFLNTSRHRGLKVCRADRGKAWSENPPSRSRRFVSDIEVEASENKGELKVFSNLLQFRSRRETEESMFVCKRRDVMVKEGDNLLIKDRLIILDSNVLNASYATFL